MLVNYVVQHGRKWAAIARALEGRRTEHMVKNRYKSLLSRQYRLSKDETGTQEEKVLRAILEELSTDIGSRPPADKLPREREILKEIGAKAEAVH